LIGENRGLFPIIQNSLTGQSRDVEEQVRVDSTRSPRTGNEKSRSAGRSFTSPFALSPSKGGSDQFSPIRSRKKEAGLESIQNNSNLAHLNLYQQAGDV
jgi:hypothetical protein